MYCIMNAANLYEPAKRYQVDLGENDQSICCIYGITQTL